MNSEAGPVLEARGLEYKVDHLVLLKNIDLYLERSRCYAVVGPNGAGKSTLLKCLSGILRGQVRVLRLDGQEVEALSAKARARLIGYLPQELSVQLPIKVKDLLLAYRYPYLDNLSDLEKADWLAIAEAVRLCQVSELCERSYQSLSGGEKQRVLLAAALVGEPKLLLLDEPTAFLDPEHQASFRDLLRKLLKESPLTLLLVTHDINSALLVADEIIGMQAGRLIFQSSPENLVGSTAWQALFGDTLYAVKHPDRNLYLGLPKA